MTTSTVWIDGWPYRISFTGTIEVARMWQSERARLFSEENAKAFAPVAIRRLSDDATVTVEVDQAVLKANREAVCKAFAEERMFRAFWDEATRYCLTLDNPPRP